MRRVAELLKKTYRNLFGKYCLGSLICKEIEDGWTILDVGCGRSSSLTGIEKGAWKVGLDHYEPYISRSKRLAVHDCYLLGDARALPFEPNSFDCAVATEILEHLEKEEGIRMIKEVERVVRKKIILTTPNGFLPTYPSQEDNPDEAHLSGWTVEELKEMGFKVYGINGLKSLWTIKDGRSMMRLVPERPAVLPAMISDMAGFLVYKNPHRAFQLFFVKRLKK